MYIAKAFDLVPHRRLVHKIWGYGVTDEMAKWFVQRVTIKDASSKWTDFLCGVPQGSVLGPFLFFIFINDLPDKIVNFTKLLADDSKNISCIKGEMDINKLYNDLFALGDWCRTWGMTLNVEKCKVMRFG